MNTQAPILHMRPRLQAVFAAAWVAMALGGAPSLAQAGETDSSEAAVQAAYLFNFAKFSDWPAAAFASKSSPFNYCLLGKKDALAAAMSSLSDKSIQGRPLNFIQPDRNEELKACHLVFVAELDSRRRALAMQTLNSHATLTVSDQDGFTRDGGMIRLMRVGTRLRFEINRVQTQRAGLRLSADLLNLATNIIDSDSGANR